MFRGRDQTPLPLRNRSDAELVLRMHAGETAAFEETTRRYTPELLRFCRRLSQHDPHDAVQETWAKAWRAFGCGVKVEQLRPWLYQIARNAVIDMHRANNADAPIDDELAATADTEQIVLSRDRFAQVSRAVGELPDRQRQALLLQTLNGYSYEQVAGIMGEGEPVVRQLLHRARRRVRSACQALLPWPFLRTWWAGAGGAKATVAGVAAVAVIGTGSAVVELGAMPDDAHAGRAPVQASAATPSAGGPAPIFASALSPPAAPQRRGRPAARSRASRRAQRFGSPRRDERRIADGHRDRPARSAPAAASKHPVAPTPAPAPARHATRPAPAAPTPSASAPSAGIGVEVETPVTRVEAAVKVPPTPGAPLTGPVSATPPRVSATPAVGASPPVASAATTVPAASAAAAVTGAAATSLPYTR